MLLNEQYIIELYERVKDMNIFDKIRIKWKIHRMCALMRKRLDYNDLQQSVATIKGALHDLPQERKEGLLDRCLQVLMYE